MARVQEGFFSRTISSDSAELLYFIDQTSSETDARDALLNEAPAYFDSKRQDSYKVDILGPSLWKGTVTYKSKGVPALPGGTPIRGIEFSTGGKTRHVMTAINSTRYDGSGWTGYSQGSPINEDESGHVNGTDIIVPKFDFKIRRRLTPAQLTDTYVDKLIALTGKVNNATWLGWVAKQVLFLGADGQQTGADVDIVYNFAAGDASTMTSAQTIAGISGVTYGPWDYVWVYYATETPNAVTRSAVVAKEVHVCQVYQAGDFSQLLV